MIALFGCLIWNRNELLVSKCGTDVVPLFFFLALTPNLNSVIGKSLVCLICRFLTKLLSKMVKLRIEQVPFYERNTQGSTLLLHGGDILLCIRLVSWWCVSSFIITSPELFRFPWENVLQCRAELFTGYWLTLSKASLYPVVVVRDLTTAAVHVLNP